MLIAHSQVPDPEDGRQHHGWISLRTGSRGALCHRCRNARVVTLPRNESRWCPARTRSTQKITPILKFQTNAGLTYKPMKQKILIIYYCAYLDTFDGFEGSFGCVECDGMPASSVHGVLVSAFPLTESHCSTLNLLLHVPHLREIYIFQNLNLVTGNKKLVDHMAPTRFMKSQQMNYVSWLHDTTSERKGTGMPDMTYGQKSL
jgi:hypothetical protein